MSDRDILVAQIKLESEKPLPAAANIVAGSLREKFPNAALVSYGSGNSISKSDDPESLIYDFYVIGPSYGELFDSTILKIANSLLPPNVFYHETKSGKAILRAKYAVLSISHFEKLVSRATFHSYFWARFAQPCRLICKDSDLNNRCINAIADAVETFCGNSHGLFADPFVAGDLWIAGLGVSYKAELRAEQPERVRKLMQSYGDWAERVTAPALRQGMAAKDGTSLPFHPLNVNRQNRTKRAWRVRAVYGAILSALRLFKGTQTFKGGIEYITWKIARHSGVNIPLKDWEKRHPLIAAPGVAIRYYNLRRKLQN